MPSVNRHKCTDCDRVFVHVLPQVLYPAMRNVMGDDAPDDCLHAHDTLKAKMTALTNTDITDPNYDAMVQDYMKVGTSPWGQWAGLTCLAGFMNVLLCTVEHCKLPLAEGQSDWFCKTSNSSPGGSSSSSTGDHSATQPVSSQQ